MAKICEYCGRQLNDWEECNCPGAVAAREGKDLPADEETAAKEDVSGEGAAEPEADTDIRDKENADVSGEDTSEKDSANAAEDAGRSRVEDILGSTGAEVAMDLKSLFVGMFTKPVETLSENAKREDHASSYIIAAILSVFVFIILAIIGDRPVINEAIGRGTLVIFSLSAAVAIFLFKAVYAACITLWGKKYNPDLSYSSALSTFCLLDIYDLAMLLAFTFFTALGIYELSIAILFFWLIIVAVSGILATRVLTGEEYESVIRINLILLFIFIVLIVLCLRGIFLEMCAGALMMVVRFLR